MFKKKQIVTTAFIAIASISAGCNSGVASVAEETVSDAGTPLPVRVITPRVAEVSARYHTTSTIASDADAPIPVRVQGEVVEILVEEGDWVKQGEILARLDGERLRLELLQAKANLEMTTREYERFTNLHARGLISSAAYDGMKYDMDALDATHKLAKLNYEYTFVRAPIAGFVSARDVKIGQQLNTGDTAFRVTDPTELVAYIQIPQNELARLSVGQSAHIQVDSMPDKVFTATVTRISPTIDTRNGTFRATTLIDNTNGMLAPGMFAKFEIAYEKHDGVLVIPVDAIMSEDNISVVYVVDNGSATRRIITTGIEENGHIEILSGLEGSEQIIVGGHTGLRDGSKVLANAPVPDFATG